MMKSMFGLVGLLSVLLPHDMIPKSETIIEINLNFDDDIV
tara:strand:- start:214 stop:333 length:120 start_codon:yes stop_codon:yes gene_type:complete